MSGTPRLRRSLAWRAARRQLTGHRGRHSAAARAGALTSRPRRAAISLGAGAAACAARWRASQHAPEGMERELNIMVDNGRTVVDVDRGARRSTDSSHGLRCSLAHRARRSRSSWRAAWPNGQPPLRPHRRRTPPHAALPR
ncbi:MAG: hypothetical protein ACLTSG_13640 [Lachnospiraceae bacterium]